MLDRKFKIEKGMIRGKGRFEGEPWFIPLYWEHFERGDGHIIEPEKTVLFELTASDYQDVPELSGFKFLMITESHGFYFSKLLKHKPMIKIERETINLHKPLPKSQEEARKEYSAIIQEYEKDFEGGSAFGYDLQTIALNSPEKHARLMELKRIYGSLPTRKGKRK